VTLRKFPRTHLLLASTLGAAVLFLAVALPDPDRPRDDEIGELLRPPFAVATAERLALAGLASPETLATPRTPGIALDGTDAKERVSLRPDRTQPGLYEGYFSPPGAGRCA